MRFSRCALVSCFNISRFSLRSCFFSATFSRYSCFLRFFSRFLASTAFLCSACFFSLSSASATRFSARILSRSAFFSNLARFFSLISLLPFFSFPALTPRAGALLFLAFAFCAGFFAAVFFAVFFSVFSTFSTALFFSSIFLPP